MTSILSYDNIGNPLTYYNGTKFTWTMGRRLESATSSGGTKITYTYNADGLRTGKKKGSIEYYYYWNGDKLTAITNNGNTWYFRYDGDTPIGLEFNGVEYYYVTNLQGDVIAILNDSGECVAEYSYDAWGNCTVTKDTDTIAYDNPLRYRGYYYDFDTGFYYLQSRYYDANTGRFINADVPEMISQGVYNLFSYCENDPVNYSDNTGTAKTKISIKNIKNKNWLTKLIGKYVGYTYSHDIASKTVYNKKICGITITIKMFIGYQVSTNSMISFGFNTKKTKPSVTISIGSIGKVSFGYSGGISWTKSWIEFSLAHSPKKGFTFGYSAKISIPHWVSLGLIAACVAVPFLATFGGTVITAIGASLTVAANALIPLLPRFCNALL